MEVRGKLAAKAGNGKGFKVEGQEGWFNASDAVKPFLAKIEKGAEVVVTYEKKGVAMIVSKIVSATSASVVEKPKETVVDNSLAKSPGTPVCEDCGKELKDDKYKKCYVCGKKAYKGKAAKTYDSPEKTAQIQRGNALNAAAQVISGMDANDPDLLAEMTLSVAQKFVDWLRAE